MIYTITCEESDKWDRLVKSFINYDVHYLNQYAKSLVQNEEGEPLLFYYENNSTRGINVVIKYDISNCMHYSNKLEKGKLFDIATPYGYGGFLIEGDDYSSLDNEYELYCKKAGFVAEFVRFNLFSKYLEVFGGEIESRTNNIVRSLEPDIEYILMDFEHKVRKNLKKANSSGLSIAIDENGDSIKDFLDVYYSTMIRNEAKSSFFFSNTFFESINKMVGNYAYFNVLHENKVISTELILYDNSVCYSFLGGTNSEYFHLRPNEFLKFEVIKWAKKAGLKLFVLGGGYGENDGIYKYKKSFSPNEIYKYYIGRRIFDTEKYEELTKYRNFDLDYANDYFPKYRG